jgi:acetoin utilization protein AcuB
MQSLASMRPIKLSEVMTAHPFSVGLDTTLQDAQALMRKHKVHHLPVMSGHAAVGLLSQDDIHLAQSIQAYDPATSGVEEAMASPPLTVPPTMAISDVVSVMISTNHDAALVVEHGQLIGIFTTTDAMRTLSGVLAKRRQLDELQPIPDY